ncbi:MAG: TRAP transporter large permease [Treponema sp.]|jgi:tripartite ATP-independent transporter DctM subunit|nr:TRAP transporter large permease [Treponema sp.]
MSSVVISAAVVVMLTFLFLKFPVYVSVLAGSVTYFILSPDLPAQIMAQRVIAGIESIPLLAIPFFVCSGVIMNYSGVTTRIMRFCEVVMRKVPGGLAQVNVLLSTLMGGLSGSNLADAAMEAKMLVPEMEKKGFSREFSSVVTAVSAMITPLIPPGIAMIIYGSIANVSIGRLFIAGIGPGLLLCIAMMILVGIISFRRRYTTEMTEQVSLGKAFLDALPPLLLPIIIIGGIRLGVFTPTEAGAVAIIYAVVLSLIYREFRIANVFQALKETVATTASIMMIVGAASAFAWILTRERIPQQVTAFIVSSVSNKYVFLLMINVFLLFVGMFIEGNAAMIVLVPLLVPVARAFGINDIQFAMIFIFNNAIGAISPPMGTLMFVTCGITKCKIAFFIREAVPFYIMLLVCLLLLTFVPFFSLTLVNLVWGP